MRAINRRTAQRGVAAIEFAIIFVLLFAIFYALVSYTFPLFIVQSLNHAAAQGARAALSVDTSTDTATYQTNVTKVVNIEITQQLTYLPSTITSNLTHEIKFNTPNAGDLTVVISYPNYKTNPMVPAITLPVIGTVPQVPDSLSASATIAP